jgi:hypothetical protein
MSVHQEKGPTPRQLTYLRSLASRSATTFAYPQTRVQASREIDRLRRMPAVPHARRNDPGDGDALPYATAVRVEEVDGYGSSATWKVSAPPTRPAARKGGVELARYTLAGAQRTLRLERTPNATRITDRPCSGDGRSYVVEAELPDDGQPALDALVVDYLEQASSLQAVPMASAAIRAKLGSAGAHA